MMSLFKHALMRLFHYGLALFVRVYPFSKPELVKGRQQFETWLSLIQQTEVKLLVVSDQTLVDLGIVEQVTAQLSQHKVDYVEYCNVDPNPHFDNVEQGLDCYQQNSCTAIMAIGGGSVMDCAKLIGARAVKPKQSLTQMKGMFKVLRSLPPLYAIPTTAGTGSETTIVAVISDKINKRKYAITDPVLTPKVAILLPELTTGLPTHITAATGMDALTHAIESYIGLTHTPFTRQRSLAAIKLIFNNIETAAHQGDDLDARESMLLASFYAGEAFTRTSVGYVHAIAHQFGALYGTPHGLANAVILPKVLRWYGSAIEQKLATIADYCDLAGNVSSESEKAEIVISLIESMNEKMGIPEGLTDLDKGDIHQIVQQAMKEAHPEYPVPKIINYRQCSEIVTSLSI